MLVERQKKAIVPDALGSRVLHSHIYVHLDGVRTPPSFSFELHAAHASFFFFFFLLTQSSCCSDQ
jgi:hypothetical protein